MITVDLDGLAQMTDTLTSAASASEDILGGMHLLDAEMQANPELLAYPQSTPAIEALAEAMQEMAQLSDSLITLKNILSDAEEEYKKQEEILRDAVGGFLSTLAALQTELGAAQAAQMLVIEQDTETFAQKCVQDLVADSSTEMELTSIAAVSQVIEEDYGVTGVRSNAKLAQDVENAAEEIEITDAAAAGMHVEEEEIVLSANFVKQTRADREGLDQVVAAAEMLRVKRDEEAQENGV